MSNDIVKDSKAIKEALFRRWEEIGITDVMIAEDAQNRGEKGITAISVSKWRKNPYQKSALNQHQILWLLCRYDIPCRLAVGETKVTLAGNNANVSFEVSFPYNESRALSRLSELFPPKSEEPKPEAPKKPVKKKKNEQKP